MDNIGMQVSVFMIMVFVAVVLLASSIIVPTFGSQAQASRRLRRRLFSAIESVDEKTASILRQRFYDDLSPTERALDVIPGMARLRQMVDQSGVDTRAYKVVMLSFGAGITVFTGITLLNAPISIACVVAFLAGCLPVYYIHQRRQRRIALFEEQLPSALTMVARALQAGHPFNETIKMVGEEMPDPIAVEFRQVFNDINFGLSTKAAFLSLMTRVPSMSVNTLVIAILIQTESGGRLSEIVSKMASVIRGRFKLDRKVKALSAEGRLSAWILTLLPFALALVITVTTPSYLPGMIDDPLGRQLIGSSFAFVFLGIVWMRKIIQIKY